MEDDTKDEEDTEENAPVDAPEAPQGEETPEGGVDTDSEEESVPKAE